AAISACMLILAAGTASARKPPAPAGAPTTAQKTVAKEHFALAQVLFNEQKFAQAVIEYQAAYDAWPLDGFLFNIAQCHRNLGHVPEAIAYFERYLSSPNVKNRADVEQVLADLKAKQAETRAAAAAAENKPAETKPVETKPV